ncbi:MAG: Rne/Rng family ribonuclease [Synergistetes bacterium]|nr:Rne/Rng family ribonuclease [Synergistota bacterium]MDW8191957.1 Rne/Rng family ribonuclease [Synergistota bacterium]
MLISVDEETRIALLEDGALVEFFIERPWIKDIVGNIYKGRVERVLPGMGAAFINIGIGKNGFLPFKDLDRSIRAGEEIIIQVAREGKELKGPRLTSRVSLPGHYILLLPGSDRIGVSRRINKPSERKRLKELLERSLPPGFGAVARTVSWGESDDVILNELSELLSLWSEIMEKFYSLPAPSLLYSEPPLIKKVLRDWYSPEVKEICSDNIEALSEVKKIIDGWNRGEADVNFVYHDNPFLSLFEAYGVEDELNKLLLRKVPLKCGGEVVIDRAEALTVIDVNTSSFVGGESFEKTALTTNIEAAKEIARQLRLRGIGGIVIIDFIDMKNDKNKETLIKELALELKKDKREVEICSFSPLGLLELTREREGPDLIERLGMTCPYCDGRGWVLSEDTLIMDIKRRLKKFLSSNNTQIIEIVVNPALKGSLNKVKEEWEKDYSRTIEIVEDPNISFDTFRLRAKS